MPQTTRRIAWAVGLLLVAAAALWAVLPAAVQRMGLHPDYEGQRYLLKNGRALIVATSHDQLGEGGQATGVAASELTAPYYELREGRVAVDIASIQGGPIPFDPMTFNRMIRSHYEDRFDSDPTLQAKVTDSLRIDEIDFTEYDIVFLAGGWGAAYDLAQSPVLGDKITEAWGAGAVVGGVCHGPLGLLQATDETGQPLVKGRRVTGVTDKQVDELGISITPMHPERELWAAGAEFEGGHRVPRLLRQPRGGRRPPGHRAEPERWGRGGQPDDEGRRGHAAMTTFLGQAWLDRVLRVLAGLVGVVLLMMAVGFFVMPELLAMTQLAAEPARAVGINSLRGDFGGLFLGMGLFGLLGAVTRHRGLLLVPVLFLSAIVAGRLLSIAVDDVPLVVGRALAAELVFIAVLVLSLASFRARAGRQQEPGPFVALVDPRALAAVGIVAVLVAAGLGFQREMGQAMLQASSAALLSDDRLEGLPDGLHVGLAGTGAPLPDNRRRGGSSFVKAGDHLFIVDIGPGSTLTHESMGVPLADAEAVLLTHIHSDHMGGLGELLLKAWTRGPRTEPMRVLGPEGVEPLVEGFNLAYAVDAGFRIEHHGDLVAPESGYGGVAETLSPFGEDGAVVVFQDDALTVTAFLVDHRPADPAEGYRFDYKGRSAVISGDTLPSENLRRHTRGADLLVHEVLQPEILAPLNNAAVREGQASAAKLTSDIVDYHTFPEEVARIARDEDVGHVVFHHFLPALPLRMLQPAFVGDAREIYAGPITVGAEGLVFSLAPGGDEVELGWML